MAEQPQALTVAQAMNAAKRSLESVRATVIGEVSEFNDKPGYKAAYFSVSDQDAAMPCVMWRDRYVASGVVLRAGMKVEMDGYFTAYVPKGRMQFTVNTLRMAGEGDLRVRVAELARRLEGEGLMAPSRKRAIPRLPQRIALVTSPRGKAVHDVMRTLRRRYPLAELLIAGVTVEGEGAPAAIAQGLEVAAAAQPDVILLVRGGGSYEDLMPFNSELVARAVAFCPVPVVTGIGHEPDTTIADMVSDLRASTPTAAAEAVAPSVEEIASRLAVDGRRLGRALEARLASVVHRVERLADRPVFVDPMTLTGAATQALDGAAMRLTRAIPDRLDSDARRLGFARDRLVLLSGRVATSAEHAVTRSASRLHDLSPLAILGRGYSLSTAADGSVVRSIDDVPVGGDLSVRVANGVYGCVVATTRNLPSTTTSLSGGTDE